MVSISTDRKLERVLIMNEAQPRWKPDISIEDIEINIQHPYEDNREAERCNISWCSVDYNGLKFYFRMSKSIFRYVVNWESLVLMEASTTIRSFRFMFQ